MKVVKTIKDEGLQGYIDKNEKGFYVNVQYMGHGKKEFYEILNDLGLIRVLDKLNVGERIAFYDRVTNSF